MPYVIGGNHVDAALTHPIGRAIPESATERAERERPPVADRRPCGGFMLGGNSGHMLGSGN